MEKIVMINGIRYSMKRTGYGQYIVTSQTETGFESVYSTDSITFDWMDDDGDMIKHEAALKSLERMFV
jgi:hypothetical protein